MAGARIIRTQHDELADLETPICDAENSISILQRLLDMNFSKPHTELTGSPERFHLSESQVSDMLFAANLVMTYVAHIKAQWDVALEAGR